MIVDVRPDPPPNVLESLNSNWFRVVVQGGSPTAYRWFIEPVPLNGTPIGNYPATPGAWNVFSPHGTGLTLMIRRMSWFASPDSNLGSVTGYYCIYEINCEVTVNNQLFRDQSPPWLIVLVEGLKPGEPWVLGETYWPDFAGWDSIVVNQRIVGGAPEWFVAGQGSFQRSQATLVIWVTPGSQFYNKVLVHESEHVRQLNVDPRWARTFDANDLYTTVLQNLTSRQSEADLRNQIMTEILNRQADDMQTLRNSRQQREVEAYAADRAVTPHYLEKTDAEVRLMYP